MDELKLKLSSWGLKSIVTNMAKRAIFAKIGVNPDISLNDLDVEMKDGTMKARLDVEISVPQAECMRLLKNAKIPSAIMDKT